MNHLSLGRTGVRIAAVPMIAVTVCALLATAALRALVPSRSSAVGVIAAPGIALAVLIFRALANRGPALARLAKLCALVLPFASPCVLLGGTYNIDYTVAGLTEGVLTIKDLNNPAAIANITEGAGFTYTGSGVLESGLSAGQQYDVNASVTGGQTCSIQGGSAHGTIAGQVILDILCTPMKFSISVNVTGLVSGSGEYLAVQLTAADSSPPVVLTADISSSGSSTLLQGQQNGTPYSVTLTQPKGQSCAITSGNASGSVTADVVLDISCHSVYSISGTVTGLKAGSTLRITDLVTNAASNVTGPGSFTLESNLISGESYDVALAPPLGQTCSVASGVASGTIAANVTLAITCSTLQYSISANVTGLVPGAGEYLTVQLAATGIPIDLTSEISSSGSSTLVQGLQYGASYTVTLLAQPKGQSCAITSRNASGSVTTNVVVSISCHPVYSISGTITGLAAGTSIRITDLVTAVTKDFTGSGSFTLESHLAPGAIYDIMLTQPVGQTCNVTSGAASNTFPGLSANVVLGITCAATPKYTITGKVTGLTGNVKLTITDTLTGATIVTPDGNFTLETLYSGTYYNVTLTSPPGYNCSITSGVPTNTFTGIVANVVLTIACTAIPEYSITGTVTGLAAHTTLTITDTKTAATTKVTGPGSFTLETIYLDTLYDVTLTPPAGQSCSFTSGTPSNTTTGITANVVLAIGCKPLYSIGGTVTGLTAGTTLTITDTNSGAAKNVSGPGSFTLESGLTAGTKFNVTLTPPPGQVCSIVSGTASGTIAGNVVLGIDCTAQTEFSIDVSVTGLVAGLTLSIYDSKTGATANVIGVSGAAPVTATLENGLSLHTPYNVTLSLLSGQNCSITSGAPTNLAPGITADVTLGITCASPAPVTLNGPKGLAFDSYNNLYVANAGVNQVLVFSEQLGAGNVLTGLTQIRTISSGISSPARLAFDSKGNLYVANSGANSITIYDTGLKPAPKSITTGIEKPEAVAVDESGDVYVGNNSTSSISIFTGSPTAGFTEQTTLFEDGAGNFFGAPGVMTSAKIDGVDDLFVGLGPPIFGDYVYMYSAPLTASSDPTGSLSNLDCKTGPSGPTGIAIDPTGTVIYVASLYSNRVVAYTLASMKSGPACPTPVSMTDSTSQIDQPQGLAVDAYGNIFVANPSNNTITVYRSLSTAPIYTQH
jgi:sugar lactone lactonase YvrE